jgi:hypothetical protein
LTGLLVCACACGRTNLLTGSAVPDCTGVDLQTDNGNCGACGNRCSAPSPSKAACTEGRCLVTLATDTDGALALAVDTDVVYWTSWTTVKKLAKRGGEPVTVIDGLSSGPCTLTLDGTNLYWINRYLGPSDTSGGDHCTVMQAAKRGGAAIKLATDQPWAYESIAVDATSVYWATNPTLDHPSGSIWRVAIGGGTPVTLASDQYAPTGVAVDGTSAYWTTGDYSLMKVSLGGGMAVRIGSAGPMAAVVLRDGFAYSFLGENVVRTPVDGGETETLAGSPGNTYPQGIAVDDTSVYWTEDGWVLKVPREGGAVVRLLSQPAGASGIAVDDTSVYWIVDGAGAVMKLTPK